MKISHIVILGIFFDIVLTSGSQKILTEIEQRGDIDKSKTLLKIGFLAHQTHNHSRTNRPSDDYGRQIAGAMTWAVDVINNNESLLPNHTLHVLYVDQSDRVWFGVEGVVKLYLNGVVAFFGPEVSCKIEGLMAAEYNLPMLAYNCFDLEVSDKTRYPTFVRTTSAHDQVNDCLMAFIRYLNWTQVSVVYNLDTQDAMAAAHFMKLCNRYGITINHILDYDGVYSGDNHFFSQLLKASLQRTREYTFCDWLMSSSASILLRVFFKVFVFFGGKVDNSLQAFLQELDRLGGTDGHHVVIAACDSHYVFKTTNKYPFFDMRFIVDPDSEVLDQDARRRGRHLLVLSRRGVDKPSKPFQDQVKKYNHKPPFNIQHDSTLLEMPLPDSAVNLYDSVFVYARALHEHLAKNGDVRDGSGIISLIFEATYSSVTGRSRHIDKRGNLIDTFKIMSMNKEGTAFHEVGHFKTMHIADGNHTTIRSLIEKGEQSTVITTNVQIFVESADKQIHWFHGVVPKDEPPCGFYGEKCIPKYTRSYTVTILSITLTAVFVLIFSALSIRHVLYERRMKSLLWRISTSQLAINTTVSVLDSESSVVSDYSGDGDQYTTTAIYKGNTVALKFIDKNDVCLTKEIRDEMTMMRGLSHRNVATFYGAYSTPTSVVLVTAYLERGSLQDVLSDSELTLDFIFKASFVSDILKGLGYIHGSRISEHGNMKSSNCLISCRWTLQLTDFCLLSVRHQPLDEATNNLWTAPEILRSRKPFSSHAADVYAFGIILHEIWIRNGPFNICSTCIDPRDIIEGVKNGVLLTRPTVEPDQAPDYIITTMKACWREEPKDRPSLSHIKKLLRPIKPDMRKQSLVDTMMKMMEKHQNNLEVLVSERTDMLNKEREKSDLLLHRMLPRSVADVLRAGGTPVPEAYDAVTIFFSDIVAFTDLCSSSAPLEVVDFLNDLYTLFDSTIATYDVYKVETIGDAYMVVSGLPDRNGDRHAGEIASMALQLRRRMKTFNVRHRQGLTLSLRIGMHTGACAAGVAGVIMPRFCLFGDTVNTASRMESNGQANKIHVSKECRDLLMALGGFYLEERGMIQIKGKGELLTYWLIHEDSGQARKKQDMGKHWLKLFGSINASRYKIRTPGSRHLRMRPSIAIDDPMDSSTLLRKGRRNNAVLCKTRKASTQVNTRRSDEVSWAHTRDSREAHALGDCKTEKTNSAREISKS